MSTTITTRLDETPERPDSAGVAGPSPSYGERSDALALRADRTVPSSRSRSRRYSRTG